MRPPHQASVNPLNCFTQPVMATSVGKRSMLDAPKKPTMPFVLIQNVPHVGRFGDRSAVTEHQDVRVHRLRGVGQLLHALRGFFQRQRATLRRCCPWSSAPCAESACPRRPSPSLGFLRCEHVGARQQVEFACRRRSCPLPCRKPMPVSSRPTRRLPSNSPTVGKFCTPLKPASLHVEQEPLHDAERIGAAHAGEHRRLLRRPGSTSRAMSMTIWLASP